MQSKIKKNVLFAQTSKELNTITSPGQMLTEFLYTPAITLRFPNVNRNNPFPNNKTSLPQA